MSTRFPEPVTDEYKNIDGWILPDYDKDEFVVPGTEGLEKLEELNSIKYKLYFSN